MLTTKLVMAAEVAEPEVRLTIPREVTPSKNSTDPVAVPAPGAVAATVAVKVTDCPKTEGVVEANVVVVLARMVATFTEVLVPPKEVTIAVRLPRDGAVSKVTINWVEVAEVTWPVPLLKVTVFILGVGTKLVPAMVTVAALIVSPPVLRVIVGVAIATVGKLPKGLVQPVAPCR